MDRTNLIVSLIIIIVFFIAYIIYLYFYNRNKLKNEKYVFLKSIFLMKPLK